MKLSFGLRSRARQLGAGRKCVWRGLLAVVPAILVVIVSAIWVTQPRKLQTHGLLVLRGASGEALTSSSFEKESANGPAPDSAASKIDISVDEKAAAAEEMIRRAQEDQATAGPVASAPITRPPLNLFLVWTGSAALPVAEFERLLTDVLSQTSSPHVHLIFLLDESHMGGGPKEAVDALLQRCRTLANGRDVPFSWVITSVQAFEAASGTYKRICADFKANVSPGAQVYTCNYLFKPLMWEIVEQAQAATVQGDAAAPLAPAALASNPSAATIDGTDYAPIVLALDTDLRIAGDISDMLLEHVPGMRDRGSLFALVEEQQPTYAFNSPKKAQGWNGGVQLIDARAMAGSPLYVDLVGKFTWSKTDPRWRPATDLGDQTLYSVLNYSAPQLFLPMGCQWNRQMCRIWFTFFPGRDRTSKEDFLHYEGKALCAGRTVRVLHGNCKSNRPGSDELAGLPDAWQPRNEQAEAEMEAAYQRMLVTPEEVLQGRKLKG